MVCIKMKLSTNTAKCSKCLKYSYRSGLRGLDMNDKGDVYVPQSYELYKIIKMEGR